MQKLVLGAITLVALGMPSAFAADLPVKVPPTVVTPMFGWSGCYIGASIGWAQMRDRGEDLLNGALSNQQPIGIPNMASAKLGGLLGCNIQRGRWIFSVEGDAEYANFRGGADYANTGGPPPDSYVVRAGTQGSLRGRLGVAWDRSLFFLTGGLAVARVEHVYFQNGNSTTEAFDKTRWGWTFGGGLDYALSGNFIGRIEYRYSDFGMIKNDTTIYAPGYVQHQHNDEHALRAALIYKFGGPVVAKY